MKKTNLRPLLTALLLLAWSGAAMAMALILQPGPVMPTLQWLKDQPLILLLNWLPMAVTCAVVWAVSGNAFFSGGVSVLVWGALSYINLVKMTARGDPFVPGDILLVFEGIEAVGSYQLNLYPGKLLLLAGVCGILFALAWFFRPARSAWWKRLAVGITAAAVFVTAMAMGYSDDDLYQGLPGPDRANVPQVFQTFGFPYVFLHNFRLYPVDKPEGYSQTQAQKYEQTYRTEQTLPEKLPNIVMIMCEAFTDLPNESAFTYSREENPIAFYNELAASEQSFSGQLIVSNIGAGTANTEFDVLTGMMTNRLGEGTGSAFRVVHRNTDSIPRALASVGYGSFFLHPGQNWFYNRESVYSYLGITDQVFQTPDFTQEDYKGGWITDASFAREMKENILRKEAEGPLFAYGVTIQNHQAYTYGKYGFEPAPVQTDLELTPQTQETLSVYFEGLRDSDAMLKDMVAWLQTQEEPYVLVFFGDHQPNLGGDYKGYRELGLYPEDMDSAENRLSLYTVPFLIWGNSAFHENADFSGLREDLGEEPTISSHYLGALTCRAAGITGLDGYFDYINDLCVELPVCSVYGYRTADGAWLEQLQGAELEAETLRWHWQYYRLRHQKMPSES